MTEKQESNVGAYMQCERDKYEQQGMGIGLTISTMIVEIYGGKLKTNSRYREFTEVSVSLPLADNKNL